jgi:large subunit ribosomal protein L15
LYRRIPKLKHFPLVNPKSFTIVNVKDLASLPANSEVTLDALLAAGILTSGKDPLKVLGDGEITVPLVVRAAAFTRSAKAKIEAVGGSCEVIN